MEAARPATESDLPAIIDLAAAMRAELAPQRGGDLWAAREARPGPDAETLAALLARDDARVVVGTIDGAVIAFATVELVVLRDGRCLGVIRDLFVDPDARAVGVGEAIAEIIVAFCTGAGCIGIDAYALPGARDAKNFFERNGFVARSLTMHKRL